VTRQQATRWMDLFVRNGIPPLIISLLSWSATKISKMGEDINTIKTDQAVMKEQISQLKGK
jgi:hypothetical protein